MKRIKNKALYKNVNTVKALKAEGHDLVDALCSMGMTKNAVYDSLRERLGCIEGKQHFYNLYTIRDTEKAVGALQDMLVERRKVQATRRLKKADRPHTLKKYVLPDAEQKAAFRELDILSQQYLNREIGFKPPSESWWTKLLRFIIP